MVDNNFSTYFRPQTFSEVVGQETVKAALMAIARAEGIACRGIFLKGAYGCGKTTLARIFAAAMNDRDFRSVGDVTPGNCGDVYAQNSQLYLEFDASVAGNIDAIRALSERLATIPQGRRVVVFDECHACSKAALNALLKIVEDGVPNTIFVFCSTEDILPTIKSRCLYLELTIIPKVQMIERLRVVCNELNLHPSASALDQICLKSNGHMRDALSILQLYSIVGEDALRTSFQEVIKYFTMVFKHDVENATKQISVIMAYPIVDIRNSLIEFIRGCFIAGEGDVMYPFRKANLGSKLLGYFYNPVIQAAMKDEFGIELTLRSFVETVNKR